MMIYTVTTIQTITDKGKDNDGTFWFPYPTFGDKRCWGYFASLEDALIAVDEYGSDIQDDMYEYCIIEAYSDGMQPRANDRYLFKWDTNKFIPVVEPDMLNSVVNFAIG